MSASTGSTATRRAALAWLTAATAIGSVGLAAGGVAGALLAVQLTGAAATAGLPLGAVVAGSAGGALLIARLTRRYGRTVALVVGYLCGTAGAGTVVVAAASGSFTVVLAGSLALGAANAAVFLSRYAAADLTTERTRGRVLGVVLGAAAAGAVAGPLLLEPTTRLAAWLGLPTGTGLYVVATAAFTAAAGLIAVTGPPRAMSAFDTDGSMPGMRAILTIQPAGTALAVLAGVNLAMVAVMAVAPVHLSAPGHGLGHVGPIIGAHVVAMFLPAPATGMIADKLGPVVLFWGCAAALLGSAAVGLLSDAVAATTVALVLLGVGWNAGVVGASAALVHALPSRARTRAEALGEVAMGAGAGIGAPVAGVVAGETGLAGVLLFGVLGAAAVLTAARGQSATTRHDPRR